MSDVENPNSTTLKHFGVSSVLSENAEIYYSPIFDTNHVGMFSDLVVACFKDKGSDELKLRGMLILGILYGFKSKSISKNSRNPLLVECGIDRKIAAFAVSFILNEDVPLSVTNLETRVQERNPASEFEKDLVRLFDFSDRFILKFEPIRRKIEVILVAKMNRGSESEGEIKKDPPEVILFNEASAKIVTRSGTYRNLGDLDLIKLLRQTIQDEENDLTFGSEPAENQREIVIPTRDTEPQPETVISADDPESESKTVISGGESPDSEQKIVISGKGGVAKPKKASTESAESDSTTVISDDQEDVSDTIKIRVTGRSEKAAPDTQIVFEGDSFEQMLKNAEKELLSIKDEMGSPKAREWTESLLRSVVRKKSEINEKLVNMTLEARQKELELKRTILTLKEQLESARNQVTQKDKELTLYMDQVTQMKTREMSKHEQKAEMLQKMLTISRDENAKLVQRLNEVKKHVKFGQSLEPVDRAEGPEGLEWKQRYERLNLQAEEFRKANRQLMDRLNEMKKVRVGSSGAADSMKQRYELTVKLLEVKKKENDDLRKQVVTVLTREKNLKNDLARIRTQIGNPKAVSEGTHGAPHSSGQESSDKIVKKPSGKP